MGGNIMKTNKLIELMKMGHLVVPNFLIKNYHKLDIDANTLITLVYLLNNNTFDCKKIGNDLNINDKEVLNHINKLQEKGLLTINIIKNDKGIMEESILLDPLYNKISLLLIDEEKEKPISSNIYDTFERELGRTLSPMEYEIITGWLNSKYKEEIIIEALREAVYSGANNLRYIDKILYEWHKKGFKSINDIKKDKEHHRRASEEKKIELPDYNWLEDNEQD
jgi:DNA replication protein